MKESTKQCATENDIGLKNNEVEANANFRQFENNNAFEGTVSSSDELDTIFCPQKNLIDIDTICAGFYHEYGLAISKFYKSAEEYEYDLDHNGKMDEIIMLLPFYYLNSSLEDEYKEQNSYDKVIIFRLLGKDEKYENYIFSRVLNPYSYVLGNESLYLWPKNIELRGSWGHSNLYLPSIFISYFDNQFYVDSITIEENGIKQYKKSVPFSNKSLPLEKFSYSILDSLRL